MFDELEELLREAEENEKELKEIAPVKTAYSNDQEISTAAEDDFMDPDSQKMTQENCLQEHPKMKILKNPVTVSFPKATRFKMEDKTE